MADEQQSQASQFKLFENALDGVAELYHDSKSADVHFTFGSNATGGTEAQMPAHKNLLAAGSKVFKAMFYGDLKETGNVRVVDTSDAAFKEFLQYFYRRQIKLSAEHIVEVMYLGQKYNVPKCIEDCVEFFKQTVNNKVVCSGLYCAILYDQIGLLESCVLQVMANTAAVFEAADFSTCDRRVLDYILTMDFLSCSEVEVFEACMAWAKAKSEQNVLSKEIVDAQLGDTYYKIRFASMTIQQLCALQEKYDSVLSSDFITITKIIAGPKFRTDRFVTTTRQFKRNTNAVIKAEREPLSLFFDSYECLNLKPKFSTNVPLILDSFVCLAVFVEYDCDVNVDLRWNMSVGVTITETPGSDSKTEKVLCHMDAVLKFDETHIALPQPILIRPGFLYSICFGAFANGYAFRAKLFKQKLRLEPDIIVKFHDEPAFDDSDEDTDDEGDSSEDADDTAYGFLSQLNFNNFYLP